MTLFGAMQAVVCEAGRVEGPREDLTVARGAASRALRQGPEALGSRSMVGYAANDPKDGG